MMKLIAISIALFITSCDAFEKRRQVIFRGYAVRCVRGITFVLGESGISWLPDANGLPVTCEE
jgi:DNA-directed RNA polymerase specialized sigma subunit